VIIDEVQKIPQILDEIHRLIEKRKLNFCLTGSSARKLIYPQYKENRHSEPNEFKQDSFTKQKESFYRDIIARRPDQVKFLRGWLGRVAHTDKQSREMLV
jgi:hypothetical protein